MRLAARQVRVVVADRPDSPAQAATGQGYSEIAESNESDASDEEVGYCRSGGGVSRRIGLQNADRFGMKKPLRDPGPGKLSRLGLVLPISHGRNRGVP